MLRRQFLGWSASVIGAALITPGCRDKQFARVKEPGQPDMVGSHQAGAETFKPLVDEAVVKLLERHSMPIMQASHVAGAEQLPPPPKRICFICVENKSAEEIGDFKEQLYECIDSKILSSQVFQPVSKRFVDAGLRDTRLRPDQLFSPDGQRTFAAYMEQQGQPFDYLLFAKLTSGTTRENKEYQRDYLLTLELVDIRNGQYDKQSAEISKGYHKSRVSRMWNALQ